MSERKELFKLIKKEFVLGCPPWGLIMTALGMMVGIPSYPSIVGVGYCFLALFSLFGYYNATKDMEMNAILPVKRNDVVVAKAAFVFLFQVIYLSVAAVGALLANFVISPDGNPVGIAPNFAYFGIVFSGYGVFNLIFLTSFFKTGYKPGLGALFGTLSFCGVYAVAEILVQTVPALTAVLDGLGAGVGYRLLVFAVGFVAWVALTLVGIALSKKRFDKISL